jgi:hypothetical protein
MSDLKYQLVPVILTNDNGIVPIWDFNIIMGKDTITYNGYEYNSFKQAVFNVETKEFEPFVELDLIFDSLFKVGDRVVYSEDGFSGYLRSITEVNAYKTDSRILQHNELSDSELKLLKSLNTIKKTIKKGLFVVNYYEHSYVLNDGRNVNHSYKFTKLNEG